MIHAQTIPRAAERIAYSSRPARRRKNWRDRPDGLLRNQPWPHSAASLHPGPEVAEAAAEGHAVARAIINAYQPALAWQGLIRVEAVAA